MWHCGYPMRPNRTARHRIRPVLIDRQNVAHAVAARMANDADSEVLVSLDRAVGANARTIRRPTVGLTAYELESVTNSCDRSRVREEGRRKKDEQPREGPRRNVPPSDRFVIIRPHQLPNMCSCAKIRLYTHSIQPAIVTLHENSGRRRRAQDVGLPQAGA